jgi:hypothetical protein
MTLIFISGQLSIELFGEVFLKISVPFIEREKHSPGGESALALHRSVYSNTHNMQELQAHERCSLSRPIMASLFDHIPTISKKMKFFFLQEYIFK